jgi:hypothetical protein
MKKQNIKTAIQILDDMVAEYRQNLITELSGKKVKIKNGRKAQRLTDNNQLTVAQFCKAYKLNNNTVRGWVTRGHITVTDGYIDLNSLKEYVSKRKLNINL